MTATEETLKLDEATRQKLRTRALGDLYFFIKGVLGFSWLTPAVHRPICNILQNPDNSRVRVLLPRGWLKSTVASVGFPMWTAVRDPNETRILIVQNSQTNAMKKLAVIKSKFDQCQLLRILFPECIPDKTCTWSTDKASIPRSSNHGEETFETAGTGTKVVSRHFSMIIEDDTVSPDLDDMTSSGIMLPSPGDIEQAIGWHREAESLLINPPKGSPLRDRIVLIGTRWFEKDLMSWNEDHEKHYIGYSRAVRETNGLPDEAGTATYPERFDDEKLRQLEASHGPYLFSCLYMNKPVRAKDMVFRPEWITYYDSPPASLLTYTTVDPGGDPTQSTGEVDNSVIITTGKDLASGKVYVLDYFCKKCSVSETIAAVFDHVRRYRPVRVGIESIGFQKQLIYWIKERMRGEQTYFNAEPIVHGHKSKDVRIQGLQPGIKEGTILFRTHHRELIQQLIAFIPGREVEHDDLPDALSMQLPMWRITHSITEEKRAEHANDPLRWDYTERELLNKHKPKSGFLPLNASVSGFRI